MNKFTIDDLRKAKCKFRGYYKYTFFYDILLDDKKIGEVSYRELSYNVFPNFVYRYEVKDGYEPLTNYLVEAYEFIELIKCGKYVNRYGDVITFISNNEGTEIILKEDI